jgi:polar amino acid transport system substrate-binding protein
MNHRRYGALAAAAALAALLSACSSAGSSGASPAASPGSKPDFTLASSGTLTVAVSEAEPPFLSYTTTQLGGLIGDTVNGFAEEYGLKVKILQTTFASTLLDVQQGRADMTLNIFYTPERAKTVYYTVSSVQLPVAVMTKKGFDFTGTGSLQGKKIGSVVGEAWATVLEKEFGANLTQYQTEAEAGQALINGQIDAYVNGLTVTTLPPLAGRTDIVGHTLTAGEAGIPSSLLENTSYNLTGCQNAALAKAYDKYVTGLQSSGKLATLIQTDKIGQGFQIAEPKTPAQGCS